MKIFHHILMKFNAHSLMSSETQIVRGSYWKMKLEKQAVTEIQH